MPIAEDLLEILCCPVTKVPVAMLPEDKLAKLNEAIEQGEVKKADGNAVEAPLQEGLITEDGKTVYRIDDEIPIMLADEAIATDQLGDF